MRRFYNTKVDRAEGGINANKEKMKETLTFIIAWQDEAYQWDVLRRISNVLLVKQHNDIEGFQHDLLKKPSRNSSTQQLDVLLFPIAIKKVSTNSNTLKRVH